MGNNKKNKWGVRGFCEEEIGMFKWFNMVVIVELILSELVSFVGLILMEEIFG